MTARQLKRYNVREIVKHFCVDEGMPLEEDVSNFSEPLNCSETINRTNPFSCENQIRQHRQRSAKKKGEEKNKYECRLKYYVVLIILNLFVKYLDDELIL